jgi:hypothetical protein
MTRVIAMAVVTIVLGALAVSPTARTTAQQRSPDARVALDVDDIGGMVTSTDGPEAGIWVIAETTDLPTKLAKIVVTDDRGRYLIPDLPKATYSVWVRGYGLVDSPRVTATPGRTLNLTATLAPGPAAAAQYYPAIYWFSMLRVPDKSEFPGTGPTGNGISPNMATQSHWLRSLKTDGCVQCHQLGERATRQIPASLGSFNSSADAWARRLQSGQGGRFMSLNALGTPRALALFSDWTDRIAAGDLPRSAPPRPTGLERNIVITLWDWADPKTYLHDEIASDKRNPTQNANGLIYGSAEDSADYLPTLNPVTHTAGRVPVPVRDPNTPLAAPASGFRPSPFWGEEAIWTSRATVHNPMLDHKGRVWLTSRIRGDDNPAFCKAGSSHPSARLFPVNTAHRHLAVYDPATKKVTPIGTCFGTHHLQFAEDTNNTLWMSGAGTGRGDTVGWFNTKQFDETGDEEASQGWTALILDTNGNGMRDAYVEPDQPIDPAKDKRVTGVFYGIAISPVDGAVWGSIVGMPGQIVRLSPGSNPPSTTLAEVYQPPFGDHRAPVQGYGPRGVDIDRNGVLWVVLASGHLASFDRRKCKGPLNGPAATGQQCPEGWTLHQLPGPQMAGVTEAGSAESPYYDWVDQFDVLGLGRNVPFATGNQSDALFALVDGKFVTLRVPYPIGFYAKGLDGRIDDSKAGWKGRGIWSTYGTRTPFHVEGGLGTTSKVVKFQLRPNALSH